MGSEILAVPDENLRFVIHIIRLGLRYSTVKTEEYARRNLLNWCDEMEKYLESEENE